MQKCSSCGGMKAVRPVAQTMPSKGATPYGYEKSGGSMSKVAAQSGMSTSTMNPYGNNSGNGFSRVGAQSGMNSKTMNPLNTGNPSTRVSPSYGNSSFAGQRFSTTGNTGSGGLSISKYVGRGS